ncbi:unnamed protein product [Prunus armeniaca]
MDLGASVNLLRYSIYKQLGLGELKPTSITLQLADRSVKIPIGMVEDVLVQVDKFYFPVDFIVLDTEPVVHSSSQIHVILGRPFLATSNAQHINCSNGLTQLSFGNMTLELHIFNICKQPGNNENDQEVNMIETIVQNSFNSSCSSDSMQICLVQEHNGWVPKHEVLPTVSDKTKSSREEAPKCELKPLPAGLKYVFLREDETYIVVISSKLKLLHEDYKPVRQAQRRLNPTMK